jgi:hypothetical protein
VANAAYKKYLQSALSLNPSVDMDTDSIKVLFVKTAYTVDLTAHQYVSDVTTGNILVRSAALAGVSVTNGIFDANDITTTMGTATQVSYLILYDDTPSTDATKPLILYIDTATGLPFTTAGDVTITWDNGAAKIFQI